MPLPIGTVVPDSDARCHRLAQALGARCHLAPSVCGHESGAVHAKRDAHRILVLMAATEGEPIAQGDLAKTPFAHLVLYIQRRRLSGTLVVDRVGFESKVLFRNGLAVAARPLPRGTALQDGLLELCDLARATYAFFGEDLLVEANGVVKGTLDTLAFVADSARGHVRDAVVASVVDRYRGVRLRLSPDADLKRLGLRGQDRRTVERLRDTPMTPEEFAAQSGLSADDSRSMLYLLVVVGYIAVEGSDSLPPGIRSLSPQTNVSNWPTGALSGPPERSSQPMFPSSPPRHSRPPDSMRSGPPGASQRPVSLSSLPAWQQLASMRPGPSRTPLPSQVVIPSTAPPPFETLDNPGKLRRAEQLAEHRNFDEATRIVDGLIARDPGNADYLAMRAWLQYQLFVGNEPPKLLQDLIERSLRLNEQQPRALYLKGLVLKRMGRESDALRYFQQALDADPQHREAQRELRLAKMRR